MDQISNLEILRGMKKKGINIDHQKSKTSISWTCYAGRNINFFKNVAEKYCEYTEYNKNKNVMRAKRKSGLVACSCD